METLLLLTEVDQVDVSNLQGIENLVRRQVQLEMAVERTPSHPDFAGLSEIMVGPIRDSGAANAARFRSWVGERQQERAQVLKQGRIEREELAAQRPAGPNTNFRANPKAKAKNNKCTPCGGADGAAAAS